MEISRDRFIAKFAISFHVHCLRMWRTRRNAPPTYVTTCLYEWIRTCGGEVALEGAEFSALSRPVIEALHRRLPPAERPDADLLAGLIYDALDEAGVEVTLQKPSAMPAP